MFKLVRKITSKIILMFINPTTLTYMVDKQRVVNAIRDCESKTTFGEKTKFFFDAKVNNFQTKDKVVIGNNTHIRGQLLVFKYGGSINIGDNCYIGDGTRIWSGESITIGNNVLISHNVSIVDTNSHEIDYLERSERYIDLISNGPWASKGSIKTSPIVIKDYAWISFGAIILKGVTIGKGAIVAAGSIVTKDVEDFTVVAGNPAVFIKKIL